MQIYFYFFSLYFQTIIEIQLFIFFSHLFKFVQTHVQQKFQERQVSSYRGLYCSGSVRSGEYGTFELRIRSEFYCSNDVIVRHISLPHFRETIRSIFISCLLQIVLSPFVKEIVCMKGIIKSLHMKTHLMMIFSP